MTDPQGPSEPAILVARDGAVATVTINEPVKRNALSIAVRQGLIRALGEIEADPAIRVVVLTGAGMSFCAGGDISGMLSDDPLQVRRRMASAHEIVRLIVYSAKTYIAAVNGTAFGAGFSIACCCDVVIASAEARFCASFTRLGLFPDLGLLWSLPGRVGAARARQLMLTGSIVDAAAAERIGIADHLAGPGIPCMEAALRVAADYEAVAPVTTAVVKAAFARGTAGLEEVLRMEADGQPFLLSTQDHAAARDAFFAKEMPRFSGR